MRSADNRSAVAAIGATLVTLCFGVYWSQSSDAERASRRSTPAWATQIESAAEHITPLELTERLLADPKSVLLVDVRPSIEFEEFHLPGAHNLDLPTLLGPEGEALLGSALERMVVLYSNGMVHPAQAWVELAQRGHSHVFVLEGGLAQLYPDVLTPRSLRPGMTKGRARLEQPSFVAAQELYLGNDAREFER